MPSQGDIAQAYAVLSGRDLADLKCHRGLAFFKLAYHRRDQIPSLAGSEHRAGLRHGGEAVLDLLSNGLRTMARDSGGLFPLVASSADNHSGDLDVNVVGLLQEFTRRPRIRMPIEFLCARPQTRPYA